MSFDSVMTLLKDPKKYEQLQDKLIKYRKDAEDAMKALLTKELSIEDRESIITSSEKKFEKQETFIVERENAAQTIKTDYTQRLESINKEKSDKDTALLARESSVKIAEGENKKRVVAIEKLEDELTERSKAIVAEETRLDGIRVQYDEWLKSVKQMSNINA